MRQGYQYFLVALLISFVCGSAVAQSGTSPAPATSYPHSFLPAAKASRNAVQATFEGNPIPGSLGPSKLALTKPLPATRISLDWLPSVRRQHIRPNKEAVVFPESFTDSHHFRRGRILTADLASLSNQLAASPGKTANQNLEELANNTTHIGLPFPVEHMAQPAGPASSQISVARTPTPRQKFIPPSVALIAQPENSTSQFRRKHTGILHTAVPFPSPAPFELQRGTNSRDAVIQAYVRFLGNNILPFTLQKQNAVISGISNVLQDGVTASDISLNVIKTYDSITPNGNRKLLELTQRQLLQTTFPAVDVLLNITTSQSKAQNESETLLRASNQTYALASSIGQQGLQTQQIVVQNSSVVSASTPVAPTTSSPPPPTPPPSESTTQSPPSESPSESVVIFSSPPPASTPAATTPASQPSPGSATGTGNSGMGASSQSSGGGISAGAIVGIVVGVVVLLAVAALLFVWRRRRRSKLAEQADVIDYYSGVGKPGAAHTAPIIANSSSGASTAPSAPVRPQLLPAVMGGRAPPSSDEKVEYSQGFDKAEVQPLQQKKSAFMDVKL